MPEGETVAEKAIGLADKVTEQRIAEAEARGRREQYVDGTLQAHENRLRAINGRIDRMVVALHAVEDAVDAVKTKVETADTVGHALAEQATEAIETATKRQHSKRDLWIAAGTTMVVLIASVVTPLVAHILGS